MANRQGTEKSKIALISARNSGKASVKLTKMDRLAVAIGIFFERNDLAAASATELAIEMDESPLFIEFVRKHLSRIESASDQEGKELQLISCLAALSVAARVDVAC
jgi:hypothetical protein